MTTFNASAFTTLLTTADKNGARVPALKMGVALVAIASHMEQGANIALACDLYGVPASERKAKTGRYNAAKGFYKDYLKQVSDMRQYLAPLFAKLETIEFKGQFAKVADQVLSLDIFGANDAPINRTQWVEFLNGFVPQTDTKAKAKSTNNSAKAKSTNNSAKPAKAKDNADQGAAKRAADDNVTTAVERLMSKVESHTSAIVNHQLEQLDLAGLPKKYRAMVSKAMLTACEATRTDIEKQLKK